MKEDENKNCNAQSSTSDFMLEDLKCYHRYYNDLLTRHTAELTTMPEGRIVSHRIRGQYRFYHVMNHYKSYLSRVKEELLIKQLFRKRFLLRCTHMLRNNLVLINCCIENWISHSPDLLYADFPPIESAPFLSTAFPPLTEKCYHPYRWEGGTTEHGNKYPEQLCIRTQRGDFVRSKSDGSILASLLINSIKSRWNGSCSIITNIKFSNGTT